MRATGSLVGIFFSGGGLIHAAVGVGTVICDGIDANAEMVRQGMAWVYVQYAPVGPPCPDFADSQRTGYDRPRLPRTGRSSPDGAPGDWTASAGALP